METTPPASKPLIRIDPFSHARNVARRWANQLGLNHYVELFKDYTGERSRYGTLYVFDGYDSSQPATDAEVEMWKCLVPDCDPSVTAGEAEDLDCYTCLTVGPVDYEVLYRMTQAGTFTCQLHWADELSPGYFYEGTPEQLRLDPAGLDSIEFSQCYHYIGGR